MDEQLHRGVMGLWLVRTYMQLAASEESRAILEGSTEVSFTSPFGSGHQVTKSPQASTWLGENVVKKFLSIKKKHMCEGPQSGFSTSGF